MLGKVFSETMVWTSLVFEIQGVKVDDDITIFLTDVLIFPDMSIYVPWILRQSKSSWDSNALF